MNDVPMILEADIGIGIYGKEGLGAVNNADFGIAQFKFLWQLLFKWGRWNYYRVSDLTCFFYYKNFSYSVMQIIYLFLNGFSG